MYRILIIVALFTVSSASGQKIGLRASIGSSWLGIKSSSASSYYSEGSSNLCWSLGISANVKIVKSIYLQPEILFAQTSGSYTYVIKRTPVGEKEYNDYYFYDPIKMNQVQFPLNVKLKLGKLYLMSGPSYSILFGNKNAIHRKGSSYTSYYKFDKDDIGLNSSVGFEVNKKPSVNIEIRHYRGFTKLDNNGYHQSFISFGSSVLF